MVALKDILAYQRGLIDENPAQSIIDAENVYIDDSQVNKYKENEREARRQQRYNQA